MKCVLLSIINKVIASKVSIKRVMWAMKSIDVPNTPTSDIDVLITLFKFCEDFKREGWCKTELRSALHTLFHLNERINNYAYYWF